MKLKILTSAIMYALVALSAAALLVLGGEPDEGVKPATVIFTKTVCVIVIAASVLIAKALRKAGLLDGFFNDKNTDDGNEKH